MQRLVGSIRNYPWGSRTQLANLRGEEPTQRPEAEVWFGAHPSGSATIDGQPLTEIIAEDPQGQLGQRVVSEYGDKLPFLLKLLAADAPLSLQAHPSKEQAKEGYNKENSAGLDAGDPERNYRDDNHKPEIIVALTPFRALSGFRPVERTAEVFSVLRCPELDHYAAFLKPGKSDDDEDGNLRALFTTWITIPTSKRIELIDAVINAAAQHLDRTDWIGDVLRVITDLNERYPGDVGVLGALLLNLVNLNPGEAIFTPAGHLHAYLEGLGVEIMANSDNVLRGGLTSKYVDVPELVRVVQFRSSYPELLATDSDGAFIAPAEEFRLAAHELAPGQRLGIDTDGPAIVLCVDGEFDELRPGQAGWVAAKDDKRSYSAGPNGAHVFLATV